MFSLSLIHFLFFLSSVSDQPSSARLNWLDCPSARFPGSSDLAPNFGKGAILSIESRHTPHLPHSVYQSMFRLNPIHISLPIDSNIYSHRLAYFSPSTLISTPPATFQISTSPPPSSLFAMNVDRYSSFSPPLIVDPCQPGLQSQLASSPTIPLSGNRP